ncbi:putative ribonuclease H protein At1g65750 family [Senna tora]|uniref:Putative ribonuclease H protein At1g65750 family n=1 Tax=Senna tora TaxID=362788 RepID=A0A834TW71_9FABA|nr:putative ribonuclease H protein At1g65750 family [Senna tora]
MELRQVQTSSVDLHLHWLDKTQLIAVCKSSCISRIMVPLELFASLPFKAVWRPSASNIRTECRLPKARQSSLRPYSLFEVAPAQLIQDDDTPMTHVTFRNHPRIDEHDALNITGAVTKEEVWNAVDDTALIQLVNENDKHCIGLDVKVCNFIHDNRWSLHGLEPWLPKDTLDLIKTIPFSQWSHCRDSLVWGGDASGKYTTANGYSFLINLFSPVQDSRSWRWVWKLKVPENVRVFIWQLMHGAIPTNDFRCSRGLSMSSTCDRCGAATKSILHCLRDCHPSRSLWQCMGFTYRADFFTLDHRKWVEKGATGQFGIQSNTPSSILFACTLWYSWKLRNNNILGDKQWSVYGNCTLIHSLSSMCTKWGNELSHGGMREPRFSHWIKPSGDTLKVNTDGTSLGNPGRAGIGSVVRDSCGNWVRGFFGHIGIATNM